MMKVISLILFSGVIAISSAKPAIDLNGPEFNLDDFQLLLNSSTKSFKYGETITVTVNKFIDKLLAEAEKHFQEEGVDPLLLPDVEEKIRKKIGFIHYKGSVKLTSINVKKLSSLYRSGDSAVSYDTSSKKARLDIPLKLNKLDVSCDFRAKLPPIKTHGSITGEMKDVNMIMSIGIDFNTRKAFSMQYKITKSGSIKVHFHVHKIINWLMNLIGNTATKMFKSKIINKLDNVLNKLIQKIVDDINHIISDTVTIWALSGHNLKDTIDSKPSNIESQLSESLMYSFMKN
ncbi:hypothetical protein WA026_003254 [Henosepilachna vigintioctopunctata]|uniref:Uncharacterized protein n=1 Tax=Henosepilachna vigintioctopunctata TaxID=420089 RepID=A0AAW1THB3_9CUCU